MRYERSIALALAVTTAACSSPEIVAPPGRTTVETVATAITTFQAQPVARGFAVALGAPGMRSWIVQAMRESPWREHKLTLQDFVQTREGRKFMSVAAEAVGMTESEFLQRVTELPPVDVYLPFREHRQQWSGATPLLVGATFDGDTPELTTYTSSGDTRVLRLADGTPPVPLLLLTPAEPRTRLSRAAPRSALAIEHPEELIAFTIEECEEVYSIRDAAMMCEGGGGTGGGYVPPTPGIYATHFHGFIAEGWFGDLEMRFESYAWFGSMPVWDQSAGRFSIPNRCSLGTALLTWPPHENWNGLKMISPGVTAANIAAQDCGSGVSPHGYYIRMMESDGGLQGDDDIYGYRFFSTHGGSRTPWGGQVGVNLAYYKNDGSNLINDNVWAANLKTEYR